MALVAKKGALVAKKGEQLTPKYSNFFSKLAEPKETKTQSKSKQGVRLRDLNTPNPDLHVAGDLPAAPSNES